MALGLEAPCGGFDQARQQQKATLREHLGGQTLILEKRQALVEAAERVQGVAVQYQALITIHRAGAIARALGFQVAEQRVVARLLAQEPQRPVTGHQRVLAARLAQGLEGLRELVRMGQAAVGMQADQPGRGGSGSSAVELGPAPARAGDHLGAVTACDGRGQVTGAAIGDQHFELDTLLRGEVAQQPRQCRGFVEGGDEYGRRSARRPRAAHSLAGQPLSPLLASVPAA